MIHGVGLEDGDGPPRRPALDPVEPYEPLGWGKIHKVDLIENQISIRFGYDSDGNPARISSTGSGTCYEAPNVQL